MPCTYVANYVYLQSGVSMKRKTKLLTIRIDSATAEKVAKMRAENYGLVTRIVTDAIHNYKLSEEVANEQA